MAIYDWSAGQPIQSDNTNFEWSAGQPYIVYDDTAGSTYTIECTTGTYAYTGKTLNALWGHKVSCTTGTYEVTGKTLTALWGHKIICTPGVYAVTGKTLEATYNENMTITPAVFSLLMTFPVGVVGLGTANYGDQVHMFMTMSMN